MIESYLIRPARATDQLVVELFDATNAQLVVACATLQRDNGGAGVGARSAPWPTWPPASAMPRALHWWSSSTRTVTAKPSPSPR